MAIAGEEIEDLRMWSKFVPTDEQLILHFLLPMAKNPDSDFSFFDYIPILDVYANPPWIIRRYANLRYSSEGEFYSFTWFKRSSERNGQLPRYVGGGGHWLAIGGPVEIREETSNAVVGMSTKLEFILDGSGYQYPEVGETSAGAISKKSSRKEMSVGIIWVMKEFRLHPDYRPNGDKEAVLCRISPSGSGTEDDSPSTKASRGESRRNQEAENDPVDEALSSLLRGHSSDRCKILRSALPPPPQQTPQLPPLSPPPPQPPSPKPETEPNAFQAIGDANAKQKLEEAEGEEQLQAMTAALTTSHSHQ